MMGIGPFQSCAVKGCGWPAVFKVVHTQGEEALTAFFCVFDVLRATECIAAIAALRKEEKGTETLERLV